VASSDQHTVKPWFAGKLDFAPAGPDLAQHGFMLVGGRLDSVDGRPTAALVFKRREHVINLFLQPVREGAPSTPRSSEQHGFHVLHAAVDGYEVWLVSDVSEAELRELLRRFAATL
jgi:anti-sigma factor RsiW